MKSQKGCDIPVPREATEGHAGGGFSFIALILPGMDGRYLAKDPGVERCLSDGG
ncbi:MAG: hypothetical protein HUU08_02965 [Candidatus Brocadia sp.]|nr:hypothetical protein [Candidatus Brocadia sp.]